MPPQFRDEFLPGLVSRGLLLPARAFTTWTLSRRRSKARWWRTRCSATTCLKASSRERRWRPTSNCSTSSRRTTKRRRRGNIAGRGAALADGSRGCWGLAGGPAALEGIKIGRCAFRRSAAGRSIDNLRRTLSAPCMFLTLLAGWLTPGVSPWLWTRFILTVIAIPSLIPFLAGPHRLGNLQAHPFSRDDVGHIAGRTAHCVFHHLPGLPGVADE